MKIKLKKRRNGAQLVCERSDGSVELADVGPSLPNHDLAHFVAERCLEMKDGFYGNVEQGYSLSQLGNKDVIRTLGAESWQAEVVARAVGSLATGACTADQFAELINTELRQLRLPLLDGLNATLADAMLAEFRQLAGSYEALNVGESLELELGAQHFRRD